MEARSLSIERFLASYFYKLKKFSERFYIVETARS